MSLLTQFYPSGSGSSGGGGGSANIGAAYSGGALSTPSVVFIGYEGNIWPAPDTAWKYVLPGVIGPASHMVTTASWNMASIGSVSPISKVVFNNMFATISGSTDLKVVEFALNGSGLVFNIGTNQRSLKRITGGGMISLQQNFFTELTTIGPNVVVTAPGTSDIRIRNAKLTAETVNNLLVGFVNNGFADHNLSGARSIQLNGGTSAGTSALTAAGIAARDALVAAGWTVTLNP